MSIKKEQVYYNQIKEVIKSLKSADKIVIGGGAGLSAAAGLNYDDPHFFKSHYEAFYKKGLTTIADGIARNWYLTKENAVSYWGFWANHIRNIYYSQSQLEIYKNLYDIIGDKDYFVITTNADDQFYKGLFDKERLFSMQGSYSHFQCRRGCHPTLYDNKEMIDNMLRHFDPESLTIRESDLPICPVCGDLLCPNLRIDHFFVESEKVTQRDNYVKFLDVSSEKIVFLELGVGYNTPVIIRYPFEEMTKNFKNAKLIRVNLEYSKVTANIEDKALAIDVDIGQLLEDVIEYTKR